MKAVRVELTPEERREYEERLKQAAKKRAAKKS